MCLCRKNWLGIKTKAELLRDIVIVVEIFVKERKGKSIPSHSSLGGWEWDKDENEDDNDDGNGKWQMPLCHKQTERTKQNRNRNNKYLLLYILKFCLRIKQRDIRIHLFFVIIQRSFIDYSKFLIHWESQHSKNKRKSLTESEEKVKHQFSIYNFTFKHCPSITSPTTSPQPTTHLPQYSHFFPITSNSSHKNKWIIFIFLSVVFPLFKHLKYLSSMFVTRHGHWYGTPWHCT